MACLTQLNRETYLWKSYQSYFAIASWDNDSWDLAIRLLEGDYKLYVDPEAGYRSRRSKKNKNNSSEDDDHDVVEIPDELNPNDDEDPMEAVQVTNISGITSTQWVSKTNAKFKKGAPISMSYLKSFCNLTPDVRVRLLKSLTFGTINKKMATEQADNYRVRSYIRYSFLHRAKVDKWEDLCKLYPNETTDDSIHHWMGMFRDNKDVMKSQTNGKKKIYIPEPFQEWVDEIVARTPKPHQVVPQGSTSAVSSETIDYSKLDKRATVICGDVRNMNTFLTPTKYSMFYFIQLFAFSILIYVISSLGYLGSTPARHWNAFQHQVYCS
jgi:hypothetical protein